MQHDKACLPLGSDQPIAMLLDAVVIERSVLVTNSPKTGLTFTNATDEQAQQEPAHWLPVQATAKYLG